MENKMKIAAAAFIAVCLIPLIGMTMEREPLEIEAPNVSEIAQVAQDEAEAYVEEQEAAQEYYEPVYYYSNSYWYTSDDANAEAAAKEWIAWRESGGDYGATNGRYIGRYQLDSSYLDGDYSEENQEATAEAYIADRYGSWQAAQEHWEAYGWY